MFNWEPTSCFNLPKKRSYNQPGSATRGCIKIQHLVQIVVIHPGAAAGNQCIDTDASGCIPTVRCFDTASEYEKGLSVSHFPASYYIKFPLLRIPHTHPLHIEDDVGLCGRGALVHHIAVKDTRCQGIEPDVPHNRESFPALRNFRAHKNGCPRFAHGSIAFHALLCR